jgi:hypothetical protein
MLMCCTVQCHVGKHVQCALCTFCGVLLESVDFICMYSTLYIGSLQYMCWSQRLRYQFFKMQIGILFKIFENYFRQLVSENTSEKKIQQKNKLGISKIFFTGYHGLLYISKNIPS